VALAAASVAVLATACGSDKSSTSPAARPADTTLARRILSRDLVLVRRSLPGATQRTGSVRRALTCSSVLTAFVRAARAGSPTISYRHELQLRAATYVFASDSDATRALNSYVAKPAQSCIASGTTASLRRTGYTTTTPRITTTKVRGIGQGAVGAEITIPSHIRGQPFTFHLDSTLVRDGRVLSLIDTLAGRSSTTYNQRVAAAFSKVATEAQ
jgi:hypothetical protein